MESKLKDLAGLLGRSSALLLGPLGEAPLQPTAESMVAGLRGNVKDLLQLEKVLTGLNGSGGPLVELPVVTVRLH